MGRPSKYRPEFDQEVLAYIESNKDEYKAYLTKVDDEGRETRDYQLEVNLPSMAGLANHLGVNKTTLYEWAKEHESFSNSLGKLVQEQEKRLLSSGLSGKYNSTIAKLILSSNHGYAEKTKSDVKHEVVLSEEKREKIKGALDNL